MTEEVIKIEDLKGYYRGSFGIVHAVDGVSLTVNKGDIVGIAGESGSGKTSLAELITGKPIQLLHYEGGQVYINDISIYKYVIRKFIRKEILSKVRAYVLRASQNSLNPVKKIRGFILDAMRERVGIKAKHKEKVLQRVAEPFKKLVRAYVNHINQNSLKVLQQDVIRKELLCKVIAFVPQASQNSLNPVKRIRDFILDAMRERVGVKAKHKEKVLQRVAEHFKKLGLEKSVIDKYPHELSGGMKQRVVLGISTLWNPLILIVDEPTSALDVTTQQLLIETFMHLKKTGIVETILFISHDIPVLAQICKTCMIMYAGRIIEKASMDDIINNPQHPYTKMLINSIACFNPDGSPETMLEGIPGRPPDLKNPPNGCRFYPRCPSRIEKCKENYPPFFISRTDSNPVACWLYEKIGDE